VFLPNSQIGRDRNWRATGSKAWYHISANTAEKEGKRPVFSCLKFTEKSGARHTRADGHLPKMNTGNRGE